MARISFDVEEEVFTSLRNTLPHGMRRAVYRKLTNALLDLLTSSNDKTLTLFKIVRGDIKIVEGSNG